MAVNMAQFVIELKTFDNRRVVVQQLRRAIRKPLPRVRKAIKAHAVAILPRRGGLGEWAASSRVTLTVRYASARSAGVRLKGSRKSAKDKSDLNRMDQGRIRAPSWGRRTAASWHTQSVTPGWFSTPVLESDEWLKAVDQAVDEAFNQIRRG